MLQLPSLTGSTFIDTCLLLLAGWTVWTIQVYRRLSHIPGPRTWGLSVWPLLDMHRRGAIYHGFGQLSEKYGPLVRIAPHTVLTSDTDVVRRMNAPRSPYTRAEWYVSMRMVPGEDNVITLTNEKEHDERRKKMAAGYSGKDNLTLERDLDDCILDLCNLIESRYAVDAAAESSQLKPMDLARKIQYFTVDVMSKVSLGLNFHDLRDDNDNFEYINEIETMFPKIFSTCCTPRVLMFLTDIGFLKLFAPQATAKLGMGKVLAITQKLVAERFDAEKNVIVHKPDMLGSFIKHGLTQEQAEQESVLQLLAGSDTSATGMRSTMFNLISNPKAYNKLMTEVDAAVAAGKIPRDLNQVISDSAARELPYLQACIKEGLRWLPPIVGMLAKKTPPQGDTIDGYFVPGGVSVAWSAKAIYQNTALFGPDPKAFRPDRWIHTSEGGDEPSREKITAMEKNNDLIFGNGKYMCLGKPVAMLELNKLYVELLRRFEFGLMNPENGWLNPNGCFGIWFQKDLWVTVRRRNVSV